MAFYGGCLGPCFGELHVELPGIDLGSFGLVDALSQLRGLPIVLLVEG